MWGLLTKEPTAAAIADGEKNRRIIQMISG